jgi:SAM-dependent methyltransferase
MEKAWYLDYFAEDYLRFDRHQDTSLEVKGLSRLLGNAKNKRVLDLACGYGRHLIPLNRKGYAAVGLDRSATLLRHGRDRAPESRWTLGDARHLPFRESFDAVISMFTSIGYFEDESDNFRVFQEIASVLKPSGLFILQVVNRDYLIRYFTAQEVHREDGLIVIDERAFDPIASRVNTITTVLEGGQTRRYRLDVRVYTITELDMLLSAAGLTIREVYGGMDFRACDWNTNQTVIVAEK